MTRRAWLPHPAIPALPRQSCDRGRPFASEQLARAALGLTHTSLTPTRCSSGCSGWHLTDDRTSR